MWPFLPKKCDCPDTPNNTGTSCDHSGLTTNDLIYNGQNGVCSNVTTGMTATEAFQQLDYFICSIELTQHILDLIQNNPNLFPNFNTLVNGAINCNTIIACGPPPTTTTTSTTIFINCAFTGSANQLPLCTFAGSANQLPNPTTTTTSSSTSTSTSTTSTSTSTSTSSSTTTTTTTDEPTTTTTTTTISCVSGDLSLTNNTVAGIIDEVYVAFGIWFIATATPVPPGVTYVGAQGGTNDAISVDVTVSQVSCLSLYVNCVIIESIEVPVTGTYTFAATSILNADAVTIILTETGICSL